MEQEKDTESQDFEKKETEDKLHVCVDFCYGVVCDIPQTYKNSIV